MKHVDRVNYYIDEGSDPVIQRDSSIVPRVGERVVYEDLLAPDGTSTGVVSSVEYELVGVQDDLEMTIANVYLDDAD